MFSLWLDDHLVPLCWLIFSSLLGMVLLVLLWADALDASCLWTLFFPFVVWFVYFYVFIWMKNTYLYSCKKNYLYTKNYSKSPSDFLFWDDFSWSWVFDKHVYFRISFPISADKQSLEVFIVCDSIELYIILVRIFL